MPSDASITVLPPPEQRICISAGKTEINGTLTLPPAAAGLVLFENSAAAGDAARHALAQVFARYQLATLFPDSMPTAGSFKTVKHWTRQNAGTLGLPVGCFLCHSPAAVPREPLSCYTGVRAAVICGGSAEQVEAFANTSIPMLLIAGGRDAEGLRANRQALEHLHPASKLHVITGATRTFIEPGALDEAAQLAALWFLHWFE